MILVSLVRNFVRKKSHMKQRYFLHPLVWSLMSLLMLASFVILQLSVEKIVFLGSVSDEFNWLRNTNYLSSFIRPRLDTALLEPSGMTTLPHRSDIVCFVMSAPKHRLARSVIRRTWGKRIKPLFLVGTSDNDTMSILVNEAKVFNDIIVEDFVDTYMNLTLKTAFAMKHFLRHFSGSRYFLKIDDDVLLNVDNLFAMLNDEHLPSNSIIGAQGRSVKPHRDRESKWYIPHWLYGNDSFPRYIDGPAYLIPGEDKSMFAHPHDALATFLSLISGHMVGELYLTSLKLPFFTLEDVFFTGHIGMKTLKYNLHSNEKFRTKNLPYSSPCLHE